MSKPYYTSTQWWVILAGGCILLFSMGVRQTLGLLLPDISSDLQILTADLSFGFAIQNLLWGLAAPIAGIIAERVGTQRVLLFGLVLYMGGLLLAASANSALIFFIGNALMIGVAVGATTFPLVLGAVGQHFSVHNRTMALAITSAGGSLGQFLYAVMLAKVTPDFGWSTALVITAFSGLFACLAVKKIVTNTQDNQDSKVITISGWSAIKQASAVREYQLLNIGFFVCGFHIAFLSVHMAGLVSYCGLPPEVANGSIALIGLVNIFGIILFGWAGDRWHNPWLLILIYWLRSCLLIGLLLLPKSETLFYAFSMLMGMLWLSTVPLTSAVIAQLFGNQNLASLFGIVMLSHQIGAFIGSWASGIIYDQYGSYDLALILSAALGLLAAAVHLPLSPKRFQIFRNQYQQKVEA